MRLFSIFLLFFLCYCSSKYVPIKHSPLMPLLVMKRTACYGTCPQYTISIYDDGKVKYEGKMFVDKIGCFESMLSDSLIREIKLQLNNVNFFEFNQLYDSHITDVPSTILKINLNGRKHEVVDRFNGPLLLKGIHTLIDGYVDSIIEWHSCEILE